MGIWVPPLLYAALSVVVYWPMQPASSQRLVTCGCSDIALEVWMLAWPAHAITHGLNPFFSAALNVPHGVNLASNTGMPLLGLLAAPFTLTLGPVASFNLFMHLAFFTSATAMYAVLRRWTPVWPAAFLGGLAYGFSPYMIGEGRYHLFLLWVAIPPLILAVLDHLIVRDRWTTRRAGLLLGVLAGCQYLISAEVLAESVLIAALGILILALRHPSLAAQRVRRVVAGGVWALAPFTLLAGFPIWYTLAGPQHVIGPWAPSAISNRYSADLIGPLVPTANQWLSPSRWSSLGTSLSGGNMVENGIYLGIPLIVVSVALVIVCRSNGFIRFCAVMAVVSFVLCLGPFLVIDGRSSGIALPFALLRHLPLFDEEIAGRYSLYVQLFVSALFGVGIGAVWTRLRRSSSTGSVRGLNLTRSPGRLSSLTAVALCFGLGVTALVALFPVIPRVPYTSPAVSIPSFFTTGEADGAGLIPANSVVLTYPYVINPNNVGMLWQAVDNMRFKVFGDYAITPGKGRNGTLEAPVVQPEMVENLFAWANYGTSAPGLRPVPTKPPPPDPATLAVIRYFLIRYDVGAVVIDTGDKGSDLVRYYMEAALGTAPVSRGGVLVWYDVGSRVRSA